MKMNNILKSAVAAVLAIGFVGTANAAVDYGTIAFDNPNGIIGNRNDGSKMSVGMEFTANSAFTVTSLGAFDDGKNGFSGTVNVAIYNVASPATALISANFNGTGYNYVGSSAFQDVTDVTLGSGTYMIVAYYDTTKDKFASTSFAPYKTSHPWTFNDGNGLFTLGSSFFRSGTGLKYPTTDLGKQDAYAAGTFGFSPVPEASVFAVAGAGMLGLVYFGRGFVRRRDVE
jgi:hypothetical protein